MAEWFSVKEKLPEDDRNAITDAIKELEILKEKLILAQQEAEETYISE